MCPPHAEIGQSRLEARPARRLGSLLQRWHRSSRVPYAGTKHSSQGKRHNLALQTLGSPGHPRVPRGPGALRSCLLFPVKNQNADSADHWIPPGSTFTFESTNLQPTDWQIAAATFNLQLSTFNFQPTCNLQPATSIRILRVLFYHPSKQTLSSAVLSRGRP